MKALGLLSAEVELRQTPITRTLNGTLLAARLGDEQRQQYALEVGFDQS